MEAFGFAALLGLILGFMFGVGCACAVLYTIYMGGYRKAIVEAMREPKPDRYLVQLQKVNAKISQKDVGSAGQER